MIHAIYTNIFLVGHSDVGADDEIDFAYVSQNLNLVTKIFVINMRYFQTIIKGNMGYSVLPIEMNVMTEYRISRVGLFIIMI